MNHLAALAFTSLLLICAGLHAQNSVAVAKASPTITGNGQKKSKTQTNPALNGQTNEPTTTQIYADEAFFDSSKNVGVFSGHVKVVDPRFNLQSEKLTVFVSKGENQGLEKAIAEGDVAVVRDRADPNGGPPTRAVGRSDKAVYVAATGNVELTGTPRVQEGLNTHIATSPDTVMVVNQKGELTTHGPSRTEIRQQPKEGKNAPESSPKPGTKPSPSTP